MLGDLVDRVAVVNHDARDHAALTWCGTHGAGVPVWLNRQWVEADVRITTGFVEPHFFAGFSGGPKLVAPGLAGLETVLVLHDADRIGDPAATWGVCEGNPVHDDVRAIAGATGVSYALDVVLDAQQRITAAFGGELFAMHAAARDHVRSTAMVAVDEPFDIVVSTNSGFPLDQNLYQAVKGMSAAAGIVRPGGTIVMAAECRDGFPEHGDFRAELTGAGSPAELLARIAARGRTVPDQWQVQVLARVLSTAHVALYTTGIPASEVTAAHLEPIADLSAHLQALAAAFTTRHGRPPTVCVLPEGPQTIAYVRGDG
jgi:nickel-dependent lactate racemase